MALPTSNAPYSCAERTITDSDLLSPSFRRARHNDEEAREVKEETKVGLNTQLSLDETSLACKKLVRPLETARRSRLEVRRRSLKCRKRKRSSDSQGTISASRLQMRGYALRNETNQELLMRYRLLLVFSLIKRRVQTPPVLVGASLHVHQRGRRIHLSYRRRLLRGVLDCKRLGDG